MAFMYERMEWMITAARSSLQVQHCHYAVLPLLVLAAISALVFFRNAIVGRITQWPPGPPAWPILGHLHLLGDLPHQSFAKLSQSYGPLLGLRLGRVPTIVVSSAEMAKEILQTHDLTFAYRPRITAGLHMGFNFSDVTLLPCGPYWKFLRQLYATDLFSSKRMDVFRRVREEEVGALVHAVLGEGEQGARKVELRPLLTMTANNIICRMVMGKKMTEVCGKDVKLELVSVIEETAHLSGVFYVGDYIPWLAWLDPNGYLKRMKATGQKTRALLQHVIDTRREEQKQAQAACEPHPPQDFLDAVLAASPPKDLLGMQMTDDNRMAAILDVFLGGSDTSSVTVEWAMADLINNPKVMIKLQEELDSIVGKGRLVEEVDIANLPYLGCVMKESMRLHPVTPLLIPREGVQECQIGCYKILSKTRAYVNAWAIQRDPLKWEQPLEFWPERFDEKKIDLLRGNNFDLFPFGIGRRKCPGSTLGFINVHLMLASLIQAFTWSIETPNCLNDGSHSHVVDMSEKFGLSLTMAKPLRVFATPRLPLNLY